MRFNLKRIVIYLIPTFIFFLIVFKIIGQNTDSLKTSRVPDKNVIENFKNDKDLNYDLTPKNPNTFTQWLFHWLNKIIDTIFSNKGPIPFIRWGIIVLIFVFFILKILKIKPQALFYRNTKTLVQSNDLDINSINENVDEQIQKAITEKDYRTAIRLRYLKLLRNLNATNMIEWKPNKTNSDYCKEVSDKEFSSLFYDISSIFEYAWYGQFSISENKFLETEDKFRNLDVIVNK